MDFDDFNDNQKEVIIHGKGNLLVEAGPGSGKTTVIIERIKYLINKCEVPPETFLVITFSRKAAHNLKIKLKENLPKEVIEKMQISTIHSFCFDFLKNINPYLNLLDDDYDELKTLFIRKNKNKLGFKGVSTLKNHQISAIVDKFSEYVDFQVDWEGLANYLDNEKPVSDEFIQFVDENPYFSNRIATKDNDYKKDWYNARFRQVPKAYGKYLDFLDDNNYVDYSTLQSKTLEVLKNNNSTPYTTILIDEFQDTDPLQYEIFKILIKNAEYFTAVGDIDQRIYSFRSTFKDYFDELESEFETERISLDCNYRSTEEIVKVTDNFIKNQRSEKSKKHLTSDNKKYNNPVFFIENEFVKRDKNSYINEAQKIFEIIERLNEQDNIDYGDIAVLYRKHSNQTVGYLVDKLEDANIPFSIKGQSDLAGKKEVKCMIVLLWYITRRLDSSYISSEDEYKWLNLKAFCDKDLEGVFWCLTNQTKDYLLDLQESFESEIRNLRKEIRKIKGETSASALSTFHKEKEEILKDIFEQAQKPVIDLSKISDEDRCFFEKLEKIREDIKDKKPMTILDIYYELLTLCDYFEDVNENISQVSNLATLTQTIFNYESSISQTDIVGLYFFLSRVIKGYEAYHDNEGGVQLMTVHAAKGLEFPVTILASIQKNEFPMAVKDENRSIDTIFMKDTFYTPNKFLKYKYVKDETGELKPISIEEENKHQLEEEERVVYVGMTRAADLLILSCLGENPDSICNIKPYLKELSLDDLDNVTIGKHFDNKEEETLKLNFSKYSKYQSCPFKYNLGYNLGFKLSSKMQANRGTAFHNIMEDINLKLMKNEKVSLDQLDEIALREYGSIFNISENPGQFEEFKSKLKEYYQKYSINREVLATELDFEINFDDYILNGAIDLIYKLNDNEIAILDYKYAESSKEKIETYEKQLFIYALALSQLPEFKDYTIKKAITHFVVDDHQHIVDITDEVINEQLKDLNCVARKINNNIFPKIDPKDCGRCQYSVICQKQ